MRKQPIALAVSALGLLWTFAAPVCAQTVTQISELTSTQTGERLILTAQVTRSESANSFEWRFTLRNPTENTVRLGAFTVSPRCDIGPAVITATPEGWVATKDVAAENKVVWQWIPTPAVNPTNAAQQIDPGETAVFSFLLNQPARSNGGVASAVNRFGFSGPTVGCQPVTPPPQINIPPAPPSGPTVRNIDFEVLQAMPCSFKRTPPPAPQVPSGITWTGCCIAGAPAGGIEHTTLACRFVGGVLALDPGADGSFRSFTVGGPEGTDPVLQGIKLIKVVPRQDKCPDLWPGQTFVQTGITGIRTFFPLKYTPCDTVFTLEVEFASMTRTVPRRVQEVRVNRFNFRVTVRPETLAWVVEALHCAPLGVCEVPCITDEDVFRTLLTQAGAIATAAGSNEPARLRALNEALDNFEATVIRNCLFQQQVFQTNEQGQLLPCAIFAGRLPGNRTVGEFGFGIVDTIENPCCCKLIADIVCLKNQLIGKP
jgi:hypothetical protein